MAASEDEVIASCSDDEIVSTWKEKGTWEPTPEEIINMYDMLESKGVLEFEWQCPGRRSPSVSSIKSDLIDKNTLSDEDVTKLSEPNEFDFNDEFGLDPSPKITSRRRGSQATCAQKRVARLDKVMYDIQRHRKLDELEMQLNISTGSPGTKNVKS